MKKYILILMALFAYNALYAQKGEIIYTDFEPDTITHFFLSANISIPPFYIDLDHDGENDLYFYGEDETHNMISSVLRCVQRYDSDWRFRLPYQIYHEDPMVPIEGDTIREGDVIADIEGSWALAYRFLYSRHHSWAAPYEEVSPDPDSHYYISVRHEVEGGYCYGWIDSHIYITESANYEPQEIYITIFRMAYCTIPDFPLRVGQTDFDWNTDETESKAFATIYPNPANATLTIIGENLRQIEITDMLGQRVATHQAEGPQATIDISALPTGIYFVGITDENGKRCVRKVVKE